MAGSSSPAPTLPSQAGLPCGEDGSSESGDVRSFNTPTTETIDAAGGLVTPGFIDAHVHPLTGGMKLSRCSLYEANNATEAMDLIAAYCQRQSGPRVDLGRWLVTRLV